MTAKGATNAMESMNTNELCLCTKKMKHLAFLAKTINSPGRSERKINCWILESEWREKSRDFWKIVLTRRKNRSNLENIEGMAKAFRKLISIIYYYLFIL